jgi:hypothetical protein
LPNAQLTFLVGAALNQVATGPGDVQLRFSNGAHIQCECTVIDSTGRHHRVGVPAGRALLEVVGLEVVGVEAAEDGRSLALDFGGGRRVTLVEEATFDYLDVSDPQGKLVY